MSNVKSTSNVMLDLKYKAFDALGAYIAAATGVAETDIDFSYLDDEVSDIITMLSGTPAKDEA